MVQCARFLQACLLYACCLLVIFLAPNAFAGDGVRPYVGIYGGMAFPESLHDVQGRGDFSGFSFSDFDLKSGPMAGAKFGIMGRGSDSLARWLGLEIDASYMQSKIKQQNSQVSFLGLTGTVPIDETKIQLITGALHSHIASSALGTAAQPVIDPPRLGERSEQRASDPCCIAHRLPCQAIRVDAEGLVLA